MSVLLWRASAVNRCLKRIWYLVGTRECPGQSVDLAAVAQMNLFLPRDYSAVRLRVDEAFSLRRLTAKVIGEIESISTRTAAIASGMGVTVLPESAARSLCNAANGWMARITTPSMNLPLSLNVSARGSLSPQAQAVKEILLLLVSRPALEIASCSWSANLIPTRNKMQVFIICYAGHQTLTIA